MFDEIFGSEDASAAPTSAIKNFKGKDKVQIDGGLAILDTPAHSLPPVKLLWRSMLLAAPPAPNNVVEGEGGVVGMEMDLDEVENGEEEDQKTTEPRYTEFSSASLADIFRARLKLGELCYRPLSIL